jgi:hypothetical protein
MEFAMNFLKSNVGIDSPALLSSPFMLVTLAYFGHKRNYQVTPDEAERLRRWIVVANAKGRYSRGSSETLLDQDLANLRDGGGADGLLERLRLQVGVLDVTPEELVGRNQRSALFKTMFLAFREDGAKDWYSNLNISLDHSGAQHKLQFHHIFPKAVLAKLGRTAREADDIANLAFIGGKTNRKISDKSPSDYLTALRDKVGDAVFAAQCIPLAPELLKPENYDEFLLHRRELIADRLNTFLGRDGAQTRKVNFNPHLRSLDQRIEGVELQLRDLLLHQLSDDGSPLPGHVAEKVEGRIADAIRKNPALADDHPENLEYKLQYCDFRDLQDIVTSKNVWEDFAAVFGTRESFNARCGQLAELRNTIRHSRKLNEVTRKDGEAALSWFSEILVRQLV